MPSIISSYSARIAVALTQMQDELPTLVGNPLWAQIAPTFTAEIATLASLTDPNQAAKVALQLRNQLKTYPLADQRLTQLLDEYEAKQRWLTCLQETVRSQGITMPADAEQLIALAADSLEPEWENSAEEADLREAYLEKHGKSGRLVGIKHFKADWSKLFSNLTSATVTWVTSDPKNLWPFLSNFVQLISDLREMATVKMEQQEASVLWGMMNACGRSEKLAKLHTIVEMTNRERGYAGLEYLSEATIFASLKQLADWQVVTQDETGEQWQFVEQIRVG